MADNFHFERANDIADEADSMDRPARRDQRCGYCQKGIAGADSIDHVFGKGGDGMNNTAALKRHAAMLALRDDDL